MFLLNSICDRYQSCIQSLFATFFTFIDVHSYAILHLCFAKRNGALNKLYCSHSQPYAANIHLPLITNTCKSWYISVSNLCKHYFTLAGALFSPSVMNLITKKQSNGCKIDTFGSNASCEITIGYSSLTNDHSAYNMSYNFKPAYQRVENKFIHRALESSYLTTLP